MPQHIKLEPYNEYKLAKDSPCSPDNRQYDNQMLVFALAKRIIWLLACSTWIVPMSSKFIERAWSHPCVTMEEKLVLLALAELSDRSGAVITTMDELQSMTNGSESSIDHVLGKLAIEQAIISLSKTHTRKQGNIKCKINVGNQHSIPVYAASEPIAKVPQFHKTQVKPLQKPDPTIKTINIMDLSPNVIEAWAEVIMFRSGFANQTSVWASFVDKVKALGQPLMNQDDLNSRLHAHLHSEKSYGQNKGFKKSVNASKMSPNQAFKKKMANFNFDFDD
ncbi:hypothetical protein GCM10007938_12630 [Vibrio zhanjiangensis]|uniref:Replication protein n=1 Tax=Vibrio zhanjiangensis TaxID=1046128 RepID=A0ABQ6EXP2_9VIBR|nr:hypothetical protein [Vibrio zhanjiangensis]GLT17486.1 hypothetical protein GCM10007938_12630 [Vibrio zhanjiangensis]